MHRIETLRAIARVTVLALLLGGMPITTGVIVAGDSTPAFTVDICHPLQSLEQPSLPVFAHPPRAVALAPSDRDCATCNIVVTGLRSRLADSPDPRPPELFS